MPLLFAQLYHTGQPKRVNLSLIRATGEKPKKSCERHVVWLVNKINNEGVWKLVLRKQIPYFYWELQLIMFHR